MNNTEQSVDDPVSAAVLIYWMLFGSVFVFGVLAFVLSRILEEPVAPGMYTIMVTTFGIVSFIYVAIAVFIRKYWISPEALTDDEGSNDPGENYQFCIIIQGGLLEAIAIFGLLLCMMYKSFALFVPFALTSLFFLLLFRPSRSDFDRRLERAGVLRTDARNGDNPGRQSEEG